MKESEGATEKGRRSSHADGPAIQVICLGSGGGPSEDNVTGFLVRSVSSNWSKGSVLAVDAGSHLAAITRLLEKDFPAVTDAPKLAQSPADLETPTQDEQNKDFANGNDGASVTPEPEETPITTLESGAFAGLPFPHASARANSLHLVREYVSTYLITHPHLDHISGFVINTAAFHNTSRPKRLAALPFTVNAIKTHIFNDIIWPNLTDEDGGVGFVTFQRLTEGGNIALGEGPSRGFIEVCDGLGVKGFKVSHGHCMRGSGHVHRGSLSNMQETSTGTQNVQPNSHGPSRVGTGLSNAESLDRSMSFTLGSAPGTPLFSGSTGDTLGQSVCVIDSTAYFVRAEATLQAPAREVLIFGDVEPDSISLSPRTRQVWAEAAPKIAAGMLKGIFIECSYNDSQADQVLFGHIAPRHLIAELQTLAIMVRDAKRELDREREEARKGRKRKRASHGFLGVGSPGGPSEESNKSRRESRTTQGSYSSQDQDDQMEDAVATNSNSKLVAQQVKDRAPHQVSPLPTVNTGLLIGGEEQRSTTTSTDGPLKGTKIVIIHVKDKLADGPLVGDSILAQLNEHESSLKEQGKGLGCEFVISESGASYYF